MSERKSKAKNQITGPEKNEDGELIAEDGKKVTRSIQDIYDYDEQRKEENKIKEYRQRAPKERKDKTTNAITSDTLEVPKKCEYCYLQDKCPYYDKEATCYFRNQVKMDSPQDMLDIIKLMIEMQGERVLFGRLIEETEGGYPDKNLSEEIQQLMEMMNSFKKLLSEKDKISIEVEGKNATEAVSKGGVLKDIFGGGPQKSSEEDIKDV